MTKSVTKIQDKDSRKRLSVVRSTEDPTKYGIVIVNPDGSQIRGPKGDKGDAGTVDVGSTTTGEPGTCACVENVGSCTSAILNFTIPRGERGCQGCQGEQGEPGQAATVSVGFTCTLPAGCYANVSNSGTSSSAVLNFCIPRGDKGEIGCTGPTGNGIESVTCSKSGKVTTVTITETDGDSMSFSVCDGNDGEGAGDVVGPNSSVDGDIVLFDGNSGKLIKDSSKKISCFADVSSNQTIGGTKTFTTSPVVPNKTSDATNDGTAIATEAQVKAVKDAIPNVVDNLCSTSTTSALSANQGKELKDLIDTYVGLGRFLSLWNASTGQPMSFPLDIPYTYNTGDWFMVEVVGTTNYKPNGSSYTGSASTVVDSVNNVEVRDVYIYDGTDWLFQKNNETQVSFSDIAGVPSDNACLCSALNSKANDNSVVKLSGNQTVGGVKTFSCEIVLPSKTSSATNNGTKPATEAQVYSVAQSIPTNNNQLANGCGYTTCIGTITSSDVATANNYGLVKLGSDCVQSVNAGTPSGCSGKSYAIQKDSNGGMVVNVPRENTTYQSCDFDINSLSDACGCRSTWSGKQDALISGCNIKTINSESILGYGNITTPDTITFDGTPYTQCEYDDLASSKDTDGIWRLIYE